MKDLFKLLPELNRRLFQRILEFFNRVGETEENNISKSYLAYLLGPILFYDRVPGDEEEGEPVKLQYNAEIVYDLLMQLFDYTNEIFPVPLAELPDWKNSRKSDSERRNSTSHDGSINSIPEPNSDASQLQKPKENISKTSPRSKLDVIKGKFTKSELPETAPVGTMPVNYVVHVHQQE